LHHLFSVDKSADLLVGVDYNSVSYTTEIFQENNVYYGGADLYYNFNFISIPLGLRYYVGTKVKVFFEAGFYLDMNLKSTRTGTWYAYNSSIRDSEKINEKIDVANCFGLSVASGISFPFYKWSLYMKSEYKMRSRDLQNVSMDFNKNIMQISIGFCIN